MEVIDRHLGFARITPPAELRLLQVRIHIGVYRMLQVAPLNGHRFEPVRAVPLLLLLLLVGSIPRMAAAWTADTGEIVAGGSMAHMAGHMNMTNLRPVQAGDQQKADALVTAAKAAMMPYQDYHKALSDGYKIFLPNVPQPQYHFTNYQYAFEARSGFDPLKPTSLLYKKTADGGYRLVGAMYTDRVDATEEELNNRIPLSIARWHQHTNFCKAPADQKAAYFGPNAKFGLLGSITTKEACEAAGGEFHPHVFGWMVHVYPFETDAKKIWSTNDDDAGHDNMDHSPMPGMKMD
jgi:hypothetical protein